MDRYPLITSAYTLHTIALIYMKVSNLYWNNPIPILRYIIVDDGSGAFCRDEICAYIKSNKGSKS